jgi:hypothetical protein
MKTILVRIFGSEKAKHRSLAEKKLSEKSVGYSMLPRTCSRARALNTTDEALTNGLQTSGTAEQTKNPNRKSTYSLRRRSQFPTAQEVVVEKKLTLEELCQCSPKCVGTPLVAHLARQLTAIWSDLAFLHGPPHERHRHATGNQPGEI